MSDFYNVLVGKVERRKVENCKNVVGFISMRQ